jgi:dipeptide/tripeptide permease
MSRVRMPPQVKYIVGNEACERFSYYGMSTIVVPFLVDRLHVAEHLATYRYNMFVAGAYSCRSSARSSPIGSSAASRSS